MCDFRNLAVVSSRLSNQVTLEISWHSAIITTIPTIYAATWSVMLFTDRGGVVEGRINRASDKMLYGIWLPTL